MRMGCLETRNNSPIVGYDWVFTVVESAPLHPESFNKLIDRFRLQNFSLCVQVLIHKHPRETIRGQKSKCRFIPNAA